MSINDSYEYSTLKSHLGKRKSSETDFYEDDQFSSAENDWEFLTGLSFDEADVFYSKPINIIDHFGSYEDQNTQITETTTTSKLWDLTNCENHTNINHNNNNTETFDYSCCEEQIHPASESYLQTPQNPITNITTATTATTTMKLQLCSKFEKVWYSGRPFPAFTLQVIDEATGNPVSSANGWKVMVSVCDGHGQPAGNKVCELIRNHLYEIHNGCVTILGLRFLTVSSKAGGFYTVSVNLVLATSPEVIQSCIPFVSEKVQVLSYRLFLVPKVENEALTPQDAIAKMKGIGTLTSKRFAELGIKSIYQLAALDTEVLGEEGCSQLLNHLRKNRGSLTQSKLFEYISMAREIVDRSAISIVPSSPTDPNSPISVSSTVSSPPISCDIDTSVSIPAKRPCFSHDEEEFQFFSA